MFLYYYHHKSIGRHFVALMIHYERSSLLAMLFLVIPWHGGPHMSLIVSVATCATSQARRSDDYKTPRGETGG